MDDSSFFYGLGGYSAKLAHVFGGIIWIGGVLFMAGVATPILNYFAAREHPDPNVARIVGLLERRLIGFHWMGLGALLIGGIMMAMYSVHFTWFRFESAYDWVMHLKIVLFLPIAFVNYLLGLSYRELESAREELEGDEDLSPRQIVEWRIVSLRRLNVYLAFAIIILIALL